MPKIPVLKAKDFYNYLIRYGCEPVSIRSSHFKLRNPKTNGVAAVPIHGGSDIGKGLLAAIVKELGIDLADFISFISK